ncbi:MAG: hypothetical protein V1771_01060 [Chloroflexota bacterium]
MQYGKVTPEVIAQLKEMVGEKNVLTEGLENYARDETPNAPFHPPDIVVKPEDTASVSRILKLANEKLIPVTPVVAAPASPAERYRSTAASFSPSRR